MKRIVYSIMAGLSVMVPQLAAEDTNSPELVASLFPAPGFIPIGTADHPVYRFEVIAQELDEAGKVKMKGDGIVAKVIEDTLVKPGQTREISSPRSREWRLEGVVTIRTDGFVTYRVTLLHKGGRVTSTSAGMRMRLQDGE